MEDSLRGALTVGGGIFAVLLWILSAEYLAAIVAMPLAEAMGIRSATVLVAFYLGTFAVVLAAPFAYFTDWALGETARNALVIVLIIAWFLVVDAVAEPLVALTGVPYGAIVAVIFVVPFLGITIYRFRDVGDGRDGPE